MGQDTSKTKDIADTSTPSPRASYRVALLVTGAAAMLFFLVFAKEGTPASVVDLLSSDSVTEFSMHGGSRATLSVDGGKADPDTMANVVETMRAAGAKITHQENSKIILELVEMDLAAAKIWTERMTSDGALSMQIVIEDSEFMKAAYALALEQGQVLGISADIDQWSHNDSGRRFSDYYLVADTREKLEEAFKHWLDTSALVLPANTMLAYEKTENWNGGESSIQWRSYLLSRTKELTNKDIATASVFWDPTSNKPEVLVEFSTEGSQKFGDLTGSNIGKKVAILLGANINSAPTIQARIAGGSTTISMGGSDSQVMQAEAQALVGVFSGPELPAKVDIISVEFVQPQVSESKLLLARLLMALIVGLCVGLLTYLLAILLGFVARSNETTLVHRTEQRQWVAIARPLLVSLVGIVCVLVLGSLWLPGTEEAFGGILIEVYGTRSAVTREVSWLALGLGPFMVGAVLAEGVAFLIPPWRRRRGGDTAARVPIENLSLVLGLTLLAVQAYFITRWLGSFDQGFYDVGSLSDPEFSHRAALLALLAGSALAYIIARVISRYGLGNGYALVLFAGTLLLLPDFFKEAAALSSRDAFAFAKAFMLVAIALIVTTSLIRRTCHTPTGGFTLPLTGIAPLLLYPVIMGIILIVSKDEYLTESFLQIEASLGGVDLIGVAIASVLITAFALRRPGSQIRVVAGAKSVGDVRSLAIAIVVSLAFPLGLYYVVVWCYELGLTIIPLTTLVLAPAIALDFAGEFRARFRNPDLVSVWHLQKPGNLIPLTETLARADIQCFVRGRYLRTLLSVLGPFVPMVIMVPKEKADEARELVQGQLEC